MSRLWRYGSVYSRTRDFLVGKMNPWEARPIWFDVWTRHPPRRDPVLLERVPINALGYRDRRHPDFNFQQPPNLVYKTDYVRAHYRKDYIDTPVSCIESQPSVLPLSDRIASRMVQISQGNPDRIELDDLSNCELYKQACRDLCVPDYQSAQDVEDMFVWYKKKKAARHRAKSGNLYKVRFERGGALTRAERESIRSSMDYWEAHKEIQRRARSSRLEPKAPKEKRTEQEKVVSGVKQLHETKVVQAPKTVREEKRKFRIREQAEPTHQFAGRHSGRKPQVKSVYSLLRDILSKKVERLEEARVADEKAKAQGRSGFAKLEN